VGTDEGTRLIGEPEDYGPGDEYLYEKVFGSTAYLDTGLTSGTLYITAAGVVGKELVECTPASGSPVTRGPEVVSYGASRALNNTDQDTWRSIDITEETQLLLAKRASNVRSLGFKL
jgi:hypothetical protein